MSPPATEGAVGLSVIAPAAREGHELMGLPSATGVALSARGITKRWRRGDAPILDAIDFDLPRGSSVGLQGANGAGKTTLLRILAGLFLPESGSVELDGLHPVRQRRAFQSRLGYLAAGQGG